MKTKPISAADVKNTNFFKGLDPVLRNITAKHHNVKLIENGVNVSSNIGYEKWKQQTKPRYVNRNIVKELIGYEEA